MSLGFSYTFKLDRATLSAALQAMYRRPGLSELELASEIGVGSKKGIAYCAWLLYLGLREPNRREPSPLGVLLHTKDPHLEKDISLQLLHYQLCSNPNAIVWWALANQVIPSIHEISVAKAIELLKSRGIGVTNVKNLHSDVRIFFTAYEADQVFGSLHYLHKVDSDTYAAGSVELNSLLLAYTLYHRRASRLHTSTISVNSILFENGQAGKIFLLKRANLLEALRQLEFKGLVTVAQVADLDNIGYTYEGQALDILKMCYEEGT